MATPFACADLATASPMGGSACNPPQDALYRRELRCYQGSDAGTTDGLNGVGGWHGAGKAGEVAPREEAFTVARPD